MNTLKCLLTAMCLSLAVLLASCGKQDTGKGREPQCVQKDTVVYLSPDKKGPSFSFGISYTYLTPESDTDSVTAVINSTILKKGFGAKFAGCTPGEFVTRLADGLEKNYREDVEDLYKADVKRGAKDSYPSWLDYKYDFETSMKVGADGVWCYTVTAYSFTGGAHGNTLHTCINIDAETGQLITLKDVFREGCDEEIIGLIREALYEEYDGITLTAELFVPSNFLLEKDGVTFVYNTYDIAAYADGSFWLTVPLSKLKDYMK